MADNQTYMSLGRAVNVFEHDVGVLEAFVCEMYGEKATINQRRTIDDLRYSIYCQKGGKVSYDVLPPCRNVLQQHIRRSNYQAYIWTSSNQRRQSKNEKKLIFFYFFLLKV